MKKNKQFKNLIIGDILLIVMVSYLLLGTYCLLMLFPPLFIPIRILITFMLFYILLCSLALAIPKVAPGRYAMNSKETILWFIGFVFGRIWHYPFIQYPIFNSVILRTLFLRSLGCKIPFSCAMSSDISIYDPHLITVGDSTIIGMKSTFIPHYISGGKLVLGNIVIGSDSLIGAVSEIGGNVTIEDKVRLDVKITCFPGTYIPREAHIKPYCILDNSIKIKIKEVVPAYTRSSLSK